MTSLDVLRPFKGMDLIERAGLTRGVAAESHDVL